MKGKEIHWEIGINIYMCAKSLQSCPTLYDPMDCSPPGSSVHGTLQARKLEWVAIPFSRGSSQPRGQTWVSRNMQILAVVETFSHGEVISSGLEGLILPNPPS